MNLIPNVDGTFRRPRERLLTPLQTFSRTTSKCKLCSIDSRGMGASRPALLARQPWVALGAPPRTCTRHAARASHELISGAPRGAGALRATMTMSKRAISSNDVLQREHEGRGLARTSSEYASIPPEIQAQLQSMSWRIRASA